MTNGIVFFLSKYLWTVTSVSFVLLDLTETLALAKSTVCWSLDRSYLIGLRLSTVKSLALQFARQCCRSWDLIVSIITFLAEPQIMYISSPTPGIIHCAKELYYNLVEVIFRDSLTARHAYYSWVIIVAVSFPGKIWK